MPTFTQDTTDPTRDVVTCDRCGERIETLKNTPGAHARAKSAHQCRRKP